VNLLSCLLPDAAHVRLEIWSLEPASSTITLTLHTRQITAYCPLCGRLSKRVHSRYERTLADLPWGEYAVTVRLRVRRLFCDAPCCARRIFAERLPGVAGPWARKTARLAERLGCGRRNGVPSLAADHRHSLAQRWLRCLGWC
jgi:transposase